MIVSISVVTMIILANILLRRKYTADCHKASEKRTRLRFLLPMSLWLYEIISHFGKADIFGSKSTLGHLNVNEGIEDVMRENAAAVLSFIQVGILGTCLLVAASILGYQSPLENGRIKRPRMGEGAIEYELIADDSEFGEVPVTVEVSEQKCCEEELEHYFSEACSILERAVIEGNESAEQISGQLNLVSTVPGTSISVEWLDLDYSLIYSDGTVMHERITEPVIVYLTAKLLYFDEEYLYSFPVRLMPEIKSVQDAFLEKLRLEFNSENREQAENEYLILPKSVDGKDILWRMPDSKLSVEIAVFGLLAVAVIIPGRKAELKKREKERADQMMRDYPDIISKYILLITAGMTCRAAWEKICSDYSERKIEGETGRFAYEEMLKSAHELKIGLTETEVYERFGERCGVIAYQRFGTLLSRNLKRGSRDILLVLETESQDAFSERKETVKQRGEEVGTKLLLPMIGMLCIVIAIVVVPAFTGFGI